MSTISRRRFVAGIGGVSVGVVPAGSRSRGGGADRTRRAGRGRTGSTRRRGDEDGAAIPDPASGAALFNEGYRHVARVLVGPREYDIYRYENYFADDAGIEVFRGGERLVSERRAGTVFGAEGWHHALAEFDPERITVAENLGYRTTEYNDHLSDLSAVLETVLDLILDVQEELGRGLWDNLTDLYPEITRFREVVDETKATIDAWLVASTELVTQTPKLRETATEAMRIHSREERGLTPDQYDAFEEQLDGARRHLETLASGARELVDAFEYLGEKTREIGNGFASALESVSFGVFESVTDGGGTITGAFDDLASAIESVPAPAREIARRAGTTAEHFGAVHTTANRHRDGRLEDWRTRRNVDNRLRYTFGGVAFAGLLLLSEFWSVPFEAELDGEDDGTDDGTSSGDDGDEEFIRGVQ